MTDAIQPISKQIAIVFDFDDTLVPNTYNLLLEDLGFDADRYIKDCYEVRKAAGWDGIPARFFGLVETSKSRSDAEGKITRDYLQQFGQQLQPFEGVTEMFDHLRQQAAALAPEVEVVFYLVTSGFAEVARHSAIAPQFENIWGCEFHYADDGEVAFLKRSLTYPEKPRYLYAISKGIADANQPDLLFAYDDIPPENLAVPLTQMIYVGDGTSDIPCFAMLNREGGISIGVYPDGTPQDWVDNYQPTPGQRVMTLAPASYQPGSALMESLTLAVESICKVIQVQRLGQNA
jgi:phosphoglycolate phosphatase-like HAD superfamily hydrolase